MPGLTVTEKEHWKERIAKRIDKKIATIEAEQPNLMEQIGRDAHQRALQSLGLAALDAEREQIEQQQEDLARRNQRIQRQLLSQVRGVPYEAVEDQQLYYCEREVKTAIERRELVHEDELLAANEIGARILAWRREKENLLDIVWLATSPTQIKLLWSKVAALLGDEQSALIREALAIQPLDE